MAGGRPDLEQSGLVAGLIEALCDPVLVVDAATRIVAANAPARDMLPNARSGAPLALALRAPDILDALPRVRASGAAETVQWRERVPVERLFSVRIAPPGEALPGCLVLSLVDSTAAHRVERMRSEFVANASHELRTPLASILGFVETLQGPAREDARARERFLGVMHEQASRMKRLIDDLLSLSRIEQKLHLRPTARIDLAEIARRGADYLAQLVESEKSVLDLDCEPAIVAGDEDELLRLVENLIENAIKYGAKPGEPAKVHVTLRREGRDAVLTVRDEGPGVAPEHIHRLTERFYRVDDGASRARGGTGLGLALVKHVVMRHRGRLAIESRPGEGAAFRVTIPVME